MSRTVDRFLVSENMLMWSFRYALGRRTGAVNDVVDHLKMYWNRLEPATQVQIQDEIRKHDMQYSLGNQCDIDSWGEILELETSCACSYMKGKKDLRFTTHSQYECSNNQITLAVT